MKLKELGIITIIPKGASSPKNKQQRQAYNSWTMMLHRCYDKTNIVYALYGGRGKVVDPRWLDFGFFLKDMGLPPTTKHSLDRIDTNGDYAKQNCRWATQGEQNNNQRTNIIIEYKGQRMNITQWGKVLGIRPKVLFDRIQKLGWSPKKAFNIPVLPASMEKRKAAIKRLGLDI